MAKASASARAQDSPSSSTSLPPISPVLTPRTLTASLGPSPTMAFGSRSPEELNKTGTPLDCEPGTETQAAALAAISMFMAKKPVVNHVGRPVVTGTLSEKDLSEAYRTLGLPVSASLKDATVVDLYLARAEEAPAQKDILVDSLRTIAQHKHSHYILSFLGALAMSTSATPISTTPPKVYSDNAKTIAKPVQALLPCAQNAVEWAERKGKTVNQQEGVNQAVRDGEPILQQLKAERLIKVEKSVKEPEEAVEAENASSAGDQSLITINGVHYVKVASEAVVAPSRSAPNRLVLDHPLTCSVGSDCKVADDDASTTGASKVSPGVINDLNNNDDKCQHSKSPLGTIDNPRPVCRLYTNTLIRVIVGNTEAGYDEYHVELCLLRRLLQHSDFSLLQEVITPSKPTILETISPRCFGSLLNLLHLQDSPGYAPLQHMPFDIYDLPYIYATAASFRLRTINEELKHVFGKASCLGQLLLAAKLVYELGGADDIFRSFFKHQVKDWLDISGALWRDRCCEGDPGGCHALDTKEFLKSTCDVPDLGRDILDILIDREAAQGAESTAREVGAFEDDSECTKIDGIHGGWAANRPPTNAEGGAVSYPSERATEPEASNGRGDRDIALMEEWGVPKTIGEDPKWWVDKTLFISNLSAGADVEELRKHFTWYGDVVGVSSVVNQEGLPTAAYVRFGTEDDTATAINKSHGAILWGQKVSVTKAYIGDLDDYGRGFLRPPFLPSPMLASSALTAEDGFTATAVQDSDAAWGECTLEFKKGERLTNVTGMAVPPARSAFFLPDGANPRFEPVLFGVNSCGQCGTFLASYVDFGSGD